MRIVIVGAGDTGEALLGSLAKQGGDEIAVIDVDDARCDRMAEAFDALVLHGDGTDPELLEKANIEEADALVAATGSDALNTVIVMLGRQAGVETIIAKLEGTGLRAACSEIGVTRIVSPAVSAAAEIHATLRGMTRLDFSVAARGPHRLSDVEVGRAAGDRLGELELPDGVLVVSVVRGEESLFPRDDLELTESDSLFVLVEDEDALDELRSAFAEDDDDEG